jgi:quercetin dioxygenase-like cupin family protein
VGASQDALWCLGNLVFIRIAGAATGGRLCVVELHGGPGDTVPFHRHRCEDEVFIVLNGQMTIYQPGVAIKVPAGSAVLAARDVPHTYQVSNDGPARWLVLAAPAGFDAFLVALGEPARALTLPVGTGPPDPEKFASIAARFGIDLLPDEAR